MSRRQTVDRAVRLAGALESSSSVWIKEDGRSINGRPQATSREGKGRTMVCDGVDES